MSVFLLIIPTCIFVIINLGYRAYRYLKLKDLKEKLAIIENELTSLINERDSEVVRTVEYDLIMGRIYALRDRRSRILHEMEKL